MNSLFTNKVILAPLAGLTDCVFRLICRENGADIGISEMISSEGIFYKSANTRKLLKIYEKERPVGIQLFGSDPQKIAYATRYITDTIHPDFIDLNSGCPAQKVVKNNGGSALLKNEVLFGKIVYAMVKTTSLPITVKIRSGWDINEWVDLRFGKIAQESGAAAITLHPRSKTMGFTGKSFWDRITALKRNISIPVIGNGDIKTVADALKMKSDTGCDSIMVGRATYGAPWIFNSIKNGADTLPSLKKRYNIACRHLSLYIEEHGDKRAAKEMKKHIAWYIKGAKNATAMRDMIFRADGTMPLFDALSEAFEE